MAVTMQQIADKAGVSRGTVDRALNHRGRINAEVAERIRKIAEDMGYVVKHPRPESAVQAGGLLAEEPVPYGSQKPVKIGVVTQLSTTSFMKEIHRGIEAASRMLKNRGIDVVVRDSASVDENEQLLQISQLQKEGIRALALMPVNKDSIGNKINELVDEDIPVVTFNSDISGTKRCCYVGMNNRRSGQAAAGLMGMLTGGRGKVLVITGYFSNPVGGERVEGFIEELKKSYPSMEIAGVLGSHDREEEVEENIIKSMLNIPGITGVFVVSGGQKGIAAAYENLKLEKRPSTIIYDLTEENRQLLVDGQVDFLIDQEGYVQGYEPVCMLADMVQLKKEPGQEYHYTDINIRTKYNI